MTKRYRILSMDGGPSGPTYARCLREVERRRPGFLATVDMLTGTSDGATFALSFARQAKGERNLDTILDAIEFNNRLFDAMTPTKLGLVRMIAGFLSADDFSRLEPAFAEHYRGFPTLNDLPGKVAIVTFRVKQPWGPKVYNNFGDDRDNDAKVVDVVSQSGAFPVIIPLRQGFVDGGIYANHPGMCAIAQVLREHRLGDLRGVVNGPQDLTMLSLGGDVSRIGGKIPPEVFDKRLLEWGWMQWAFHPASLMLLADLMVNAGQRGTSFHCQQVLGGEPAALPGRHWPEATSNYMRVAIPSVGLVKGMGDLILGRSAATLRDAETAAMEWTRGEHERELRPTLEQTLYWIDNYWVGPDIEGEIEGVEPDPAITALKGTRSKKGRRAAPLAEA
ncbi:MAG: patatin-like phospholipase family protein [Deltaproteobacteria bacterium]|nr:patatin-like phospholipase family protein [Deltaproteobacteria bacterium]MCB9785062.1 patatin-like phospholipase family protein [Deltaproteobacteria bacterium]